MLLLPVWFYWIKENPISCQKLHRNFLRHFLSFNTDNTMSTMSMQPQNTKSRSAWEVGGVAGTKLHIRSTSKKEALALNTYLTYSSALYCGLWANWLHLSQFTYWLLNYYGSGEKSGLVTHQWVVDYYLLDVDRCYWGGQTERVFSSAQAWILHSFTAAAHHSGLSRQQTTHPPRSSPLPRQGDVADLLERGALRDHAAGGVLHTADEDVLLLLLAAFLRTLVRRLCSWVVLHLARFRPLILTRNSSWGWEVRFERV